MRYARAPRTHAVNVGAGKAETMALPVLEPFKVHGFRVEGFRVEGLGFKVHGFRV